MSLNHSSTHPSAPDTDDQPARTGPHAAQVAGVVSFPLMGIVLTCMGMPAQHVFVMLGGCGAIGAATLAAAGGGRWVVQAVAAALSAATDSK